MDNEKKCGIMATVRAGRILCPACRQKTMQWVRPDTELKNFPLLCKKCKKISIINLSLSH
ncbi:MAG: cysteine-rich KTR domain-containing protein [Oscillospiraceae bacterium]